MANIYILGTRGIPNRYGGFERLVEVLAPHLSSRGHRVTVFCEADRSAASTPPDDEWQGVHRRYFRPTVRGGLATLQYDWQSYREVEPGAIALIFGYGTALFQALLKMRGVPHAVNMDGIEWKRAKWSGLVKLWLKLNERVAAGLSDILIADHPEIQRYLDERFEREARLIAYGVDVLSGEANGIAHPLLARHEGRPFYLVIARPEPENQVHVVLDAYARSARRASMVVIGDFGANAYGRTLMARHAEVEFAGPVYDKGLLDALRRSSELYVHGHSVGGTNPSLIEAMAAGALIVAHDNPFNRWVTGNGSLFFREAGDLVALLDKPTDPDERRSILAAARARCAESFTWSHILASYEAVIEELSSRRAPPVGRA